MTAVIVRHSDIPTPPIAELLDMLSFASGFRGSVQAPGAVTLGPTLNQIRYHTEQPEDYYSEAVRRVEEVYSKYPFFTTLRQRFGALIDRLFGEVVAPLVYRRKPAAWNTIRRIEMGAAAHWDNLNMEWPSGQFPHLSGQLALNYFLASPAYGGEAVIYDAKCIESADLNITESRHPALAIKPRIGDLLIFDSCAMHAVNPVVVGHRVAMSCFVGKTDDGMVKWS
ncbi:2OG-Fe(II) oxygenase [Nocardia pseudobrasiliensis]|uniref:2OG-Fe(II) oxygenase n=1 Tax=Nocardia pseudobrasiliensis TaxID=45979 RepID=UPI001471EEB5|nr:2OG-Fe(II) oxygenase [Nocardia pseudobrasiliensis]